MTSVFVGASPSIQIVAAWALPVRARRERSACFITFRIVGQPRAFWHEINHAALPSDSSTCFLTHDEIIGGAEHSIRPRRANLEHFARERVQEVRFAPAI